MCAQGYHQQTVLCLRNLSYRLIWYGADDESVCTVCSAVFGLYLCFVYIHIVGVLWVSGVERRRPIGTKCTFAFALYVSYVACCGEEYALGAVGWGYAQHATDAVCSAVNGLGGFNPGMCVMIEFFTPLPLTLERSSMTIFAFSVAQNYELNAQGIPWLGIREFWAICVMWLIVSKL